MPPYAPDLTATARFDLSRLGFDRGQELREAVCDAMLEMVRKTVSGEGDAGKAVFGARPSRVLSSGFLVPRLKPDGDEEASDIQIPVQGFDFRIAAVSTGEIRARPRFNVYVRALPEASEVFDPVRKLRPKAKIKDDTEAHIKDVVAARLKERIKDEPGSAAGRKSEDARKARQKQRALRQAILLEVRREHGIDTAGEPVNQDTEEDGRTDDDGVGVTYLADGGEDLRIPDQHSVAHEIPEKYVRLAVDAPELALSLPWDKAAWEQRVADYQERLNGAVRAAYRDWVESVHGREHAWRARKARSSHFWSEAAWDGFLAAVRADDPDLDRLHPGMELAIVAKAMREPLDPEVLTVRIAVENHKRTREDAKEQVESGIFQVRLEAAIPDAAFRRMSLERIERSYHLSGFLTLPAIGVNGGVEHRHEGEVHRLATTWAPRFVLPRMRPTDGIDVPVAFAELARPDAGALARLRNLPDDMRAWTAALEADPPLFDPSEPHTAAEQDAEANRFREDVEAWNAEADRVQLGVALLARSRRAWEADKACDAAKPYRAWLMMNLAFAEANPSPDGAAGASGWRLFQLSFILAHLPTLASRVPGCDQPFLRWDGKGARSAHIDAMAAEGRFFDEAFDEASASLLYMAAGGGKSEAFYGVLLYAAFLDRLRGKLRGVTAMIHYPLRLLTLQQAQRLSRILARGEIIRQRMRLGGAPFEIGFWVGNANTPNAIAKADGGGLSEDGAAVPEWRIHWNDEERLKRENPAYAAAAEAWNKLPECPFCKAATVLRRYPEHLQRLGIVCTEDGRPAASGDRCPWNEHNETAERPEPLPFLLVDADIYRRAPTVLLGTVDKLALLGNHPNTITRISGMFGLARWVQRNPDGAARTGLLLTPFDSKDLASPKPGWDPVAPAYEGGTRVFFDPVPSLVVQDEMHLLEESLGTFGGIFETGLLAWLREISAMVAPDACRAPDGSPRMPHFVGASATVSDAARQIEAIYRRDVVQFPHPGPKLYGSFYTRLAEFERGGAAAAERGGGTTPRGQEQGAPWARVYASLLTNGRPHTSTSIAVLSAHACGITRLLRDAAAGDPAMADAALADVLGNLSDAPFKERRRAALEGLRGDPERGSILATLVDLHRIQLCYVTNKKGGDQIMAALGLQAEKDHAAMGARYRIGARFGMDLISGGVTIKEIQEVIQKAERPFRIGEEDIADTLRCIVATSAISHGVDVAIFNSMAFAGLPPDVAEYIQASSRIGRTHVGFSLLIPTPQNRRDRFVVETHEAYHRFLERMIAPPAIERWADKAIQRTVPSLVQTFFAGVHHQQQFIDAPAADKARVPFPNTVLILKDEMAHRTRRGPWDRRLGEEAVAACVAFVQAAVGMDDGREVPDRVHYLEMLKNQVDLIVTEVTSGKYGSDLHTFWRSHHHDLDHPMSSLRDVDEAGEIQPATSTTRYRINREGINSAMALIRNRRPGKRSSGGETREGGKGEE